MTKYDVYGIGNALVDIEYRVVDEDLRKLNIEKGCRVLIDQYRCDELSNALRDKPCRRISGGSVANSLVALGQLGSKAYLSCAVANDEAGQCFADDLAANNVASQQWQSGRQQESTGECFVFVTPDAERSMNTYLGISGGIHFDQHNIDTISASRWVLIEGYLACEPHSCEVATLTRQTATAQNVQIALTLSDPNVVAHFKTELQTIAGDQIDLLFANEAEALGLSAVKNLQLALPILQQISKTVCVTRGESGVLIADGQKILEIPAVPTTVVDTNGAGDMFAGAFLHGINAGMAVSQAGELAAKAAAKVVAQFGPRLSAEALKLLSKTIK